MPDSWPAVALATLHDAARCLALAERGELIAARGGGLQRASWRLLHAHAAADHPTRRPLAESDLPVLSWLFRSLGMGGLLAAAGGRVRLSSEAYDWLAATTSAQLLALRQIWRRAPEVAWAWTPQTQRSPARAQAWQDLTERLVAAVSQLSPGAWTAAEALAAGSAAHGELPGVGVERNLPSVRRALRRQAEQLALFQLTAIMPRLGLIAAIDEDGAVRVALLSEGARWLRAALRGGQDGGQGLPAGEPPADPEPAAAPAPCWQVNDDLRVFIPLVAPAAATFEVLQFADLAAIGPPAEYRITPASLERGLSHGYDLADFRFLLSQGAGQPLSGAAAEQLARWRQERSIIQCEPGYRLRPLAPSALPRLRSRQPFRAATEPAASGRWAFVGQQESAALLRYLRRAGYVLRPVGQFVAGNPPPPALPPLLRSRLPLASLAILTGIYAHLRAWAPGLADLGLADLEQILLSALPAQDQAAVAHMVASNVALLAAGLSGPSGAEAVRSLAASAAPLGTATGPDRRQAARVLAAVNAAMAAGAVLEILYADTAGAVTQRRVRPLRLEERWGQQYVVAYCELRGDERSFRLDRIVQAEPL